jgi:hypothetical protein
MRRATLLLALAAAGCATTPHAWQDLATGTRAPGVDVATCQMEADREAQRSVMLQGWGGFGYPGPWGLRRPVPGWGLGMAWSPGLAIAQRSQELMAFCMRLKGYAWAPITLEAGASPAPAADTTAEPKP